MCKESRILFILVKDNHCDLIVWRINIYISWLIIIVIRVLFWFLFIYFIYIYNWSVNILSFKHHNSILRSQKIAKYEQKKKKRKEIEGKSKRNSIGELMHDGIDIKER